MNPNDPNNPRRGAPQGQQPPIQNPGLFNYGAQVATNAGPGQGAKFQELSGLYATQAVAAVPIAAGLTVQMAIPTFAETFRQGAAVKYGMNSNAYKMANKAKGADFFRKGLGGFGSLDMLSGKTMAKLGAGAAEGASPLVSSLLVAEAEAAAGALSYTGQSIAMHEMGLQASLGKRVRAHIVGGEKIFGAAIRAEGSAVLTVGNQATLRAMQAKGIGGSLQAAAGAGRGMRMGLGALRGARAISGAVIGTGVGVLPGIAMMAVTEGAIGVGMEMYKGAADASMGERIMEMSAPKGMSYSRAGARDFGMGFEQMSKSFGTDSSKMAGMMDQMGSSGEFSGVKDMTQFRKKLKSRLKELKKLSEETATTMEEVQQLTSTLKQSGIMSQNTSSIGKSMLGYNRSTGVGLDRLMQGGNMGLQQAMQMGTDLDTGFASGQKAIAGMEMLVKSGGLSESQNRTIQLMGGTDQAAMMISSSTKRLTPMMAFAMEASGKDSEGYTKYSVNKEKMEKFVRGGYSRKEIAKMTSGSDMGGKTAAFMKDTELYSQSAEQMQEAMVNFGLNNASADYTAAEIIGTTFNVHKNHAELMMNHHMAMQAAEANVGIETSKAQKIATRQKFDSRTKGGLMRSIDMGYAASGLRETGRDISDWMSDVTTFIGGGTSTYKESKQGFDSVMGASNEQLDRGMALLGGEVDAGVGSGNYGIYSAFNEEERERAYSAYGSKYGKSIKDAKGVEGKDYLLGDQSFLGDVNRVLNPFASEDKRAIDIKAVNADLAKLDKIKGSGRRLDKKSRKGITDFMRMKEMTEGAYAFEGATAFWGLFGDSKMSDDKVDALAQELLTEVGVDFTTKKGREALGLSGSTSKRDAMGQYFRQSAPDAGFEDESIRLGFGQMADAGLDLSSFVGEGGEHKVRNLSRDAVLEEEKYVAREKRFQYAGRPKDIINSSIKALDGFEKLDVDQQDVLLGGIQSAAKGDNLTSLSGDFKDAGLVKQYNQLIGQASVIEKNAVNVTKHIDDLKSLNIAIEYDQMFGERTGQLGKLFREIGGDKAGGMNFMLNGDLGKRLGSYNVGTPGDRRNLTSEILKEITDGVGNDAEQRARLIKGGVSEVYALHQAFETLTGNNEAKREELKNTLQIAGQGKGKKGAFTKEQAIEALSEIELAQFKNSDAMVAAATGGDQKQVSPAEFTTSMDKFVTSLDKFTKTYGGEEVAANKDSKPEEDKKIP